MATFSSLLICLIFIGVDFHLTVAASQHMICKPVDDVFEDEYPGQAPANPRIRQGPAGKIGPKGEKGAQGIPGTVNESHIDTLLDEKVNAVTQSLRAKMEKLQRDVEVLNASVVVNMQSRTTPQPEPEDPIECSDGFVYRKKCYFVDLYSRYTYTFTPAKQLCIDRGTKLADVVDLEHEDLIQDEMRKHLKTQTWIQAWLATTYRSSDGLVVMSDGEKVSPASFRWYDSSFPSRSSAHTNVIIEARATRGTSGLFNRAPTFTTHGAVCVIDKLANYDDAPHCK